VTRALALMVVVLLAGCGRRGSLYDAALAPLPLVATASTVVQVVPQTRRAVIVKPQEAVPAAVRISAGARAAVRVPQREVVAVLGGTARAPLLDLVDVEARSAVSLELPGAFDRLSFSADGRFGLLTADAEVSVGLAARNLNEVGLVNVAAQTVTRLQLDTEGLSPRFVEFAPVVGGRRLVAVALERGVAVFDALHPEVAPRRIALRPAGSSVDAPVVELLFSRDTHWLFVRALGLDDVIVIELGAEVGAPLSASINFVAGGVGLADLERAPEATPDAVLATFTASREVVLLDARGIQDRVKRLPLPAALTLIAPLSPNRVLLWSLADRTVVVWDAVDGRSGVAALTGVPTRGFVLPGQERAVLTMATPGVRAGALNAVTVTDEPNRLRVRAQAVQLARPATAVALSGDGAAMFLAVPSLEAGPAAVVTLELATLALSEVVLDAQVSQLFFLPSAGQVVAEHGPAPLGDVSVLPAGTSDRLAVSRFTDFAFTGDLDRPEDAR